MKASEILLEEAKKAGIESGEKVLAEVLELLEAVAPRLALEAEESWAKTAGAGLGLILPAIKPSLEKLIDINKDGQVG